MNFLFTWKHEDGSIIEFSEHGWESDDAQKGKWLTEMSDLYSSSPTASPQIRVWLKAHCRLASFKGPGQTGFSELPPVPGMTKRLASRRNSPIRNKKAGAFLQKRRIRNPGLMSL